MKNINYFKERVKEAKEESIVTINTKQYEDRLPQNSKELYYLAQLKDFLESFEKNPTNLSALKDIKNYVEQSEKENIDVSAYKALLPELTIKHYEAKLEKYFNELQKDPANKNTFELHKIAKELWINVSKYKEQLPNLTKKHYLTIIKECLKWIQEYPSDPEKIRLLETYLEEAKEVWLDISQYEAQLPNLTKKHYLTIIKECLKWIQEYPSDPEKIRLLETYLEEAKEVWLNVSEYEKLIPEIIKNYYLANLEERLKTLLENPEDEISVELFAFHLQRAIANWSDITKYIEGFKQYAKKAREARVDMDFIEKYPELNQLYLEVIKSMTNPKNLETR